MKEASEVPNFLEEVDKCREICSTAAAQRSGEFSSLKAQKGCFLLQSLTNCFLLFKWMVLAEKKSLIVYLFLSAGQREKSFEVVFLGTGSALPMKIRNVSGTLVNIRY